jgi:hypothetical protein
MEYKNSVIVADTQMKEESCTCVSKFIQPVFLFEPPSYETFVLSLVMIVLLTTTNHKHNATVPVWLHICAE